MASIIKFNSSLLDGNEILSKYYKQAFEYTTEKLDLNKIERINLIKLDEYVHRYDNYYAMFYDEEYGLVSEYVTFEPASNGGFFTRSSYCRIMNAEEIFQKHPQLVKMLLLNGICWFFAAKERNMLFKYFNTNNFAKIPGVEFVYD